MKTPPFAKPLCIAAAFATCTAVIAVANPGLTRSVVDVLPQGQIKNAASSLLPADDIYLVTPQDCGGN